MFHNDRTQDVEATATGVHLSPRAMSASQGLLETPHGDVPVQVATGSVAVIEAPALRTQNNTPSQSDAVQSRPISRVSSSSGENSLANLEVRPKGAKSWIVFKLKGLRAWWSSWSIRSAFAGAAASICFLFGCGRRPLKLTREQKHELTSRVHEAMKRARSRAAGAINGHELLSEQEKAFVERFVKKRVIEEFAMPTVTRLTREGIVPLEELTRQSLNEKADQMAEVAIRGALALRKIDQYTKELHLEEDALSDADKKFITKMLHTMMRDQVICTTHLNEDPVFVLTQDCFDKFVRQAVRSYHELHELIFYPGSIDPREAAWRIDGLGHDAMRACDGMVRLLERAVQTPGGDVQDRPTREEVANAIFRAHHALQRYIVMQSHLQRLSGDKKTNRDAAKEADLMYKVIENYKPKKLDDSVAKVLLEDDAIIAFWCSCIMGYDLPEVSEHGRLICTRVSMTMTVFMRLFLENPESFLSRLDMYIGIFKKAYRNTNAGDGIYYVRAMGEARAFDEIAAHLERKKQDQVEALANRRRLERSVAGKQSSVESHNSHVRGFTDAYTSALSTLP